MRAFGSLLTCSLPGQRDTATANTRGQLPARYREHVAGFGVGGRFRRRVPRTRVENLTRDQPTTLDEELALDGAIPDIDWRTLPFGCVKQLVSAPSGPLAHVSLGPPDGPRVLLIPGATGSKEDFILMLPLLAEAGYRVESYDLAGQYESAAAGPENLDPPRGYYDDELFVADLESILESGSTPVHVLGYSFAATVAQLLCLRRPELFASLALLSPPPEPGQAFRGIKGIGRYSAAAPAHVGAALMMWGIRNNLNRVPPGRLAFVRERFDFTRRQSVNDIIELMKHTPDTREGIRAIPIPKLIAVGTRDLWPIDLHARLAREIAASLSIYQTGHSPCETTPHQLCRDLIELYGRAETA